MIRRYFILPHNIASFPQRPRSSLLFGPLARIDLWIRPENIDVVFEDVMWLSQEGFLAKGFSCKASSFQSKFSIACNVSGHLCRRQRIGDGVIPIASRVSKKVIYAYIPSLIQLTAAPGELTLPNDLARATDEHATKS